MARPRPCDVDRRRGDSPWDAMCIHTPHHHWRLCGGVRMEEHQLWPVSSALMTLPCPLCAADCFLQDRSFRLLLWHPQRSRSRYVWVTSQRMSVTWLMHHPSLLFSSLLFSFSALLCTSLLFSFSNASYPIPPYPYDCFHLLLFIS